MKLITVEAFCHSIQNSKLVVGCESIESWHQLLEKIILRGNGQVEANHVRVKPHSVVFATQWNLDLDLILLEHEGTHLARSSAIAHLNRPNRVFALLVLRANASLRKLKLALILCILFNFDQWIAALRDPRHYEVTH